MRTRAVYVRVSWLKRAAVQQLRDGPVKLYVCGRYAFKMLGKNVDAACFSNAPLVLEAIDAHNTDRAAPALLWLQSELSRSAAVGLS